MGHPSRLIVALAILALGCGTKDKTDADATDVTEEEAVIDVVEEIPCASDDDCDNGLYCDGEETCDSSGTCQPGTDVECDDVDPCTMDSCDDDLGDCVFETLDADGDGYYAEEAPTGESCGGTDCDDEADDIHPDAPETGCDLIDKDCDGDNHEGIDDDEDGWIDFLCDGMMTDHTGYDGFGDCDDDGDHMPDDPPNTIYPGAPEGCDGDLDHDCDGDEREIDTDADGDTFPPPSCADGTVPEDCDDSDDTIYPGAPTTCDDVDDDCTGDYLDETDADDDGDTVLDIDCGGDDCDDTDSTIHPTGTVDCTTTDHDCNGHPDNDQDGDGYVRETAVSSWPACSGGDDCDDTLDTFHPGTTLSCNTIDHDCNGFGDEDNDGDGYDRDSCSGGDDCDDSDVLINPGGTVDCTTTDHDCDGDPDNDQDGDGYVRGTVIGPWPDCSGPDCNDNDGAIHPGVTTPTCDMIDDDCSGSWGDEAGADDDGDTFLDDACTGGDDCDDLDARYHPAPVVPDMCTADDYDCDSFLDTLEALPDHLVVPGSNVFHSAIAWSGSEYGAVWSDFGSGTYNVHFTRLDSSGVLVPGSDVWLITPSQVDSVSIAWSGSRWGIVAHDSAGSYLFTLASDGTDPQPPGGTTLNGSGCGLDLWPDIAYDGTQFGLVWHCDSTRIIFALATTSGAVTDMTDLQDVAAYRQIDPRIAWNAPSFGVVWRRQETSTSTFEAYFDLVDPAASPLSSGHTVESILSTDGGNSASKPDIAAGTVTVGATGPGFGVVWREIFSSPSMQQLYGAVFNLSGSSSTPAVLDTSNYDDPKIAWNGTNFGILAQSPGAPADIDFVQMDGTGALYGLLAHVHPSGATQSKPDLVWHTDQFASVWINDGAGYFAYLWCTY